MKIKEMKEKFTNFATENPELMGASIIYITATLAFAFGMRAGRGMGETKVINISMIPKENQ